MKDEYLTSKDVCQLLDVSPATLVRWAEMDILKPLQIQKRMRKKFLKSEILAIQARLNVEVRKGE